MVERTVLRHFGPVNPAHVLPPPPPNQVIFVEMKEPVPFEELLDAIWLYGVLEIGEFMVGGEMIYETESNYLIKGDKVVFYE